MQDTFDFADITPVVVGPFTILGKQYVLKEPSGDIACKYRNAMLACTELGPDGRTPKRIHGMADTEPLLVSGCLFRLDQHSKEHAVLVTEVRAFPDRIVKALYQKAKDIGGLDQAE